VACDPNAYDLKQAFSKKTEYRPGAYGFFLEDNPEKQNRYSEGIVLKQMR
jgi:hypothetical protein